LVMLVGILALSLAFIGCAETEATFSGDPIPGIMIGKYSNATADVIYLELLPNEAHLDNIQVYRISTSAAPVSDGSTYYGSMEFYQYASPYESVGSAPFKYDVNNSEITFGYITTDGETSGETTEIFFPEAPYKIPDYNVAYTLIP